MTVLDTIFPDQVETALLDDRWADSI